MHFFTKYALLTGLAAGLAGAAVDPGLLQLAMPDAKVLSGLNADSARVSPFGQYVLRQFQADAGFQQFVTDTGFDPRQDLREVLMASTAEQANGGLVAVRSQRFDITRILQNAQKHGATVTKFGDFNVIAGPPDSNHWVAFVDETRAVMGPAAAVQAALARVKGTGTGLQDAALSSKVQTLSNTNDAWFVSFVPLSQLPAGAAVAAPGGQKLPVNALKAVQQSSGGVKFGPIVSVTGDAVANSDQNARALADVVRLIAGLAQANAQDPQAKQAAGLLSNLNLTTAASTVQLSLQIPEAQIEQLLDTGRQQRAQQHKVARR